jgi:hypothetical protein
MSLFIYYLFNDALKIYSLVENHYIDYKRIRNNDLFIIYIERAFLKLYLTNKTWASNIVHTTPF